MLTCGLLARLTRLVISSETEHVGQVLAKLSGSRQASLGHTCCSRSGLTLIGNRIVASIDNIVLTIVEALSSVLRQCGWM